MSTISGSAYGRQWACEEEVPPTGSLETQLKFYDYKWIRQLLIDIKDFREKNGLDKRDLTKDDHVPYFVYKCDSNELQKLIDKMTKRMKEFEPYISKYTTAHCGYWDV